MYFKVDCRTFSYLRYLTIYFFRKTPISWILIEIQVVWHYQIDLFQLLWIIFANLSLLTLLPLLLLSQDASLSLAAHICTLGLHIFRKCLSKSDITKGKFRDKANINISTGIGSSHSNESCISTHQPDKTHAVVDSPTLYVCRPDGSNTLGNSSLKAKGFIDNGNIIVNCLWNTNNAYF